MAFKTQSVVSVGCTRWLSGSTPGAEIPDRLEMVLLTGVLRLINPASWSVPVLTDQRSTPHWAKVGGGNRNKTNRNPGTIRSGLRVILMDGMDKAAL